MKADPFEVRMEFLNENLRKRGNVLKSQGNWNSVGRPRKRWIYTVKERLRKRGLDVFALTSH